MKDMSLICSDSSLFMYFAHRFPSNLSIYVLCSKQKNPYKDVFALKLIAAQNKTTKKEHTIPE